MYVIKFVSDLWFFSCFLRVDWVLKINKTSRHDIHVAEIMLILHLRNASVWYFISWSWSTILFLSLGRYHCGWTISPRRHWHGLLDIFFNRVFSRIRVTRSLVLYVCFVDRCLSFCTFSFDHCVVLFDFDIRILISPLVSSKSSYRSYIM